VLYDENDAADPASYDKLLFQTSEGCCVF